MVQLLDTIDSTFPSFFIDDTQSQTLLSKAYNDTHEFKIQLKKMKAHLSKYINETEEDNDISNNKELNTGDKNLISKRAKKRELVIDKLNKSSRQWENLVKKQVKSTSSLYGKFKKQSVSRIHSIDLDSIYINKISEKHKNDISLAIGYHISRYGIGDFPNMQKIELLKYLNGIYGIDETAASIYITMGEKVHNLKMYNTKGCIENFDKNSDIYFELYLLDIMVFIKNKNVLKTLEYFKKGTTQRVFNTKSEIIVEKISPLITKLMLGIEVENIDELLKQQSDLCINLISRDYCNKNKLPFDSSLFLIVLSGIISLQFFVKYNNIQKSLHVDWTTKNELPFDVKLPESLSKFHSIFICPVLKEETTVENPPYSLPCHHVISRKALDKLSKNGTTSFKCPYCPVTATISKTMRVNFIIL